MASTHKQIMAAFTPERRKAIKRESARLAAEHFRAADEWDAKQEAKKPRQSAAVSGVEMAACLHRLSGSKRAAEPKRGRGRSKRE